MIYSHFVRLVLVVRHQSLSLSLRNKFTNIFGGPAPTLSSFFILHDSKVIARFLRECFEHRNTLMAAQTGHYFNLECVSCTCEQCVS